MSRKNKKPTEPDRPADQDPAQSNEEITESAAAPQDAPVSNPEQSGVEDTASPIAEGAPEVPSADDLLEDVRRALIEDEAQASQKQSKWWKRIGIGGRQEQTTDEPKVVEEMDLPIAPEASSDATLDELEDELESEEYLEQIDELIDLLDDDSPATVAASSKEEEVPAEPEKPVDIEQLKKQAFQPRADAAGSETVSEVRSIALEGDEEVFVEVESKPQDPLEERFQAVENAFKPYRRYILIAVAILGVVIAGIALAITVSAIQRLRPEPTPAVVSNLPYPTSVSLPGGWAFQLGRGSLVDGRWKPRGAEWLEGTEVCRWVSLPWSRQLEAVLRTLNPDDPIELGMSNSDRLVYEVSSIRQMSPDEMQSLDTNTPCLLIMLTEDDAEKHWVLTALP
jgi:hypothetical protein